MSLSDLSHNSMMAGRAGPPPRQGLAVRNLKQAGHWQPSWPHDGPVTLTGSLARASPGRLAVTRRDHLTLPVSPVGAPCQARLPPARWQPPARAAAGHAVFRLCGLSLRRGRRTVTVAGTVTVGLRRRVPPGRFDSRTVPGQSRWHRGHQRDGKPERGPAGGSGRPGRCNQQRSAARRARPGTGRHSTGSSSI